MATPPMDVEEETVVEDNSRGLKKIIPKGLDEKLLKHSHDADAAMKAFEGMDGQVVELTEEKSKALLRKIDWHMMPVSKHLPIVETVSCD
jgi:ACS family allantoate permease-like MFS transporter